MSLSDVTVGRISAGDDFRRASSRIPRELVGRGSLPVLRKRDYAARQSRFAKSLVRSRECDRRDLIEHN
jgi:hypothetical protein